jgi:hypothetical protein
VRARQGLWADSTLVAIGVGSASAAIANDARVSEQDTN